MSTVREFTGNLVIKLHCCVSGRHDTPARWCKVHPVAPHAQYKTSVSVEYKCHASALRTTSPCSPSTWNT